MKPQILLGTLTAFLSFNVALSATSLILAPSNVPLSGEAASTIGWGFTLTNTSDFAVITSSNFCLGNSGVSNLCMLSTIGTYTDYIANNFTIAGTVPENPVITEMFEAKAHKGVGSFSIGSGQSVGQMDTGQVVLTYDLYNTDPLSSTFDPLRDLVSAGNFLEAPAAVLVSVAVPEPSLLPLSALVIGIILVFRSKWRRLSPMSHAQRSN